MKAEGEEKKNERINFALFLIDHHLKGRGCRELIMWNWGGLRHSWSQPEYACQSS